MKRVLLAVVSLCALLTVPLAAAQDKPADAKPADPKPGIAHDLPAGMATYYLGLLSRGPQWTPEVTPATQKLFAAHLANIQRLIASGKLVVAGPILDDSGLSGIFVFKVDSLKEAEALAATDPAVQAGRLTVAVHPWAVEKGVLP